MEEGNKMNLTKETLLLFLQSLPPGSKFEIISFGSTYSTVSANDKGFDYSDTSLKLAKKQVK